MLNLSADTRHTAGIILLAVVGIEWGGFYLLRVVRGKISRTAFQQSFERAGHAHAGVLVIFAMLALILADSADLSGPLRLFARGGIPAAAILMPAGFFLSAIGAGREQPNRFVVLLYLGMAALAVGVVSLGIGLLAS
jgi:hypothetical protein